MESATILEQFFLGWWSLLFSPPHFSILGHVIGQFFMEAQSVVNSEIWVFHLSFEFLIDKKLSSFFPVEIDFLVLLSWFRKHFVESVRCLHLYMLIWWFCTDFRQWVFLIFTKIYCFKLYLYLSANKVLLHLIFYT